MGVCQETMPGQIMGPLPITIASISIIANRTNSSHKTVTPLSQPPLIFFLISCLIAFDSPVIKNYVATARTWAKNYVYQFRSAHVRIEAKLFNYQSHKIKCGTE